MPSINMYYRVSGEPAIEPNDLHRQTGLTAIPKAG